MHAKTGDRCGTYGRHYSRPSVAQPGQSKLGRMMRPILLDLDDTLIDDHSSTKIAFEAFVAAHRDRLGDHPAPSLVDRWRTAFRQFWSQYEQGTLSFLEQRRLRVRAFFADDLTDAEADDAFVPYLRAYESSWQLLPGVSDFLARTEHIPKVILTNGDREQQLNKARNTGLLAMWCPS